LLLIAGALGAAAQKVELPLQTIVGLLDENLDCRGGPPSPEEAPVPLDTNRLTQAAEIARYDPARTNFELGCCTLATLEM
jgi:hypothetical protein